MRWEGWLEYVVSPDGRTIAYEPLCPGPDYSFEAYLANFAVSAAMMQQGEEPLHSTVVEIDGRGVGLLGTSGAGKSSLAAYLVANGGRLITDDMLRITISDGKPWAQPGPLRLKLMEDSASVYMADAPRKGEWMPDSGKYLVVPSGPPRPHTAAPLAAMFHLAWPEPGDPDAVRAERLSGLELFQAIAASTMNSRVGSPARFQRQFEFATQLGQLLPIYRLSYPRNYDRLPEVVGLLKKCLP
jgi:hypothetical protein